VKALIETVVAGLVDHPEQVEIEEHGGGRRVVFAIRVHPEDRGQVIGKAGSTVDALRMLVSSIAQRHGLRADIEILD
jgi:predicted RNA-binding protein YlqC (UPF0109 family)